MCGAFILWAGRRALLRRIVLNPVIYDEDRQQVRELAESLGLQVIEEQTPVQAYDLWIGMAPDDGWGELDAQTMWASSCEIYRVIDSLENVRTHR